MTHRHRASKTAWSDRVGDEWAGIQPGYAGIRADHDGACSVTGAHIADALCSCGAIRLHCPERGASWVAPRNPMTPAERKRAQRSRAADEGLCISCCIRKPIAGRTKCQQCSDEAKEAVYRARVRGASG